MEMNLKLKMEDSPKVVQINFKSGPHHSPLYFIYFEEVILSSLMKILEWHKVSELKHSQMEYKSSQPPFISLNERSHIIFTLGFCDEMNLNTWR